MICKEVMTRKLLVGPVLAALLSAGMLVGCTSDAGLFQGSGGATVTQAAGSERPGEHGAGGETAGSEFGESGGSGSEEDSGNNLLPDESFDQVRAGARLIMNYDAASNSFKGTVENTTNSALTRVRVEVHLSNGVELGPTTPVDLAPGQVVRITLPSTQAPVAGWVAHAEVGGGEGAGGEHGGGRGNGEGGGEHSGG